MDIERGVLGHAIKSARNAKGMTQEQLAEKIGIAAKHLGQLESERRKPSVSVLYRLARTLNISVDAIFFPEQLESLELRQKIERRLRECTPRELNIIYAAVEAMTEKAVD